MVPFAYIVRMCYIFLLLLLNLLLVRFFQVFAVHGFLVYSFCLLLTATCIVYYFFRIESHFNYIITQITFNIRRPISLILRSVDFLFYSFFKLGWLGIAFFVFFALLPTFVVVVDKIIRLYATRPMVIHGNICTIILGFVMGYMLRKNLVNNIMKDYLRVINRIDWLRLITVSIVTLIALFLSMNYQLLAEFVFGFCLGVAFDFVLWFRQRINTYNIRRGLLTFTYLKNAEYMHSDFILTLLLGKSSTLNRIMKSELKKYGDTRNYYLMRCCYYFFRKEFNKLIKLYSNLLPDNLKSDPWFKHIMSGIHFSTGAFDKGIEELNKILNELDRSKKEHEKLRSHLMVNLASFYDFKYSSSSNRTYLDKAIQLCREAVISDEGDTCSYASICLAYYLAKSVDTFENGENSEILKETLDYLNKALYQFSRSENLPWCNCSNENILFSNIFYADVRGYVYMKMGIFKYARDDFANCLLMDPLYARGHFHLAELFEKLTPLGGKVEDTVFQYLKVMHVLPNTPSSIPLFKLAQLRLKNYLEKSEIGIYYSDPQAVPLPEQ